MLKKKSFDEIMNLLGKKNNPDEWCVQSGIGG